MKTIIIDTDIGCDCDDAGALAVAHALRAQGLCRLAAMTSCTSRVDGCSAVDVINMYYGQRDIPIGMYKREGFLDDRDRSWYSAYIQKYFTSRYLKKTDCEEAVRVLRRALAQSPRGETALVAIGPMVNLANLLASPPDDISPLDGRELVRDKDCRLVCMSACFDPACLPYLEDGVEWNVKQAVGEARLVYENWPAAVYTIPFETGVEIQTGASLLKTPFYNPIRICYEQYGTVTRSSWDPCAMHFCITEDETLWTVSPPGVITIDREGRSAFEPTARGRHHIVGVVDGERVRRRLDELMGWTPDSALKKEIAFTDGPAGEALYRFG